MGWVDGIREVIKLGEPQPMGGLANREAFIPFMPPREEEGSNLIFHNSKQRWPCPAGGALSPNPGEAGSIKDSHSASKKTR